VHRVHALILRQGQWRGNPRKEISRPTTRGAQHAVFAVATADLTGHSSSAAGGVRGAHRTERRHVNR
jgi:hypothetical protein